jgi:hypothetical protein
VRRIIVLLISVVLALAVSASLVSAQSSPAPGKTKQIGELSAVWWQQVLNESSPPTCGSLDRAKVSGNVSYLANFSPTGEVDANCTIPSGSRILFPIINFACSPQLSDPGTTEEALRNECSSLLDYALEGATGVFVTVDGKDITSRIVCAESPLFNLTVPDDSFLVGENLPGKVGTGPAVANGCWVLLNPLPPGEHTITFGGTFPLNPEFFGTDPDTGEPFTFVQDATYTVTVKPGSKK